MGQEQVINLIMILLTAAYEQLASTCIFLQLGWAQSDGT